MAAAAGAPLALSSAAGRIAATASSIVTREVRRCHKVTIDGFAASKKTLKGWYWSSQTFQLGRFSWQVQYVPHAGGGDHIGLHLELINDHGASASGSLAHVHPVEFGFSLLDQAGNPVPKFTRATAKVCSFNQSRSQGFADFIRHKDLEASGCLKDDRFSVMCDLTVVRNLNHWPGRNIDDDDDVAQPPPPAPASVVVPPSDLHQHLTDLLWKKKEGKDVTIDVGGGGETFDAHGWLLAARSPVFEAELLPAAKKDDKFALRRIEIRGMDPHVFKAMLHYMYTDTLPPVTEGTDAVAMAEGLLEAAHMFKLERLKLMCEETLCKRIDVGTVAGILAVAEQHGCRALKDACVEFVTRPGNLKAVMETEGFEKMKATCPGVVMEIVMKQLA